MMFAVEPLMLKPNNTVYHGIMAFAHRDRCSQEEITTTPKLLHNNLSLGTFTRHRHTRPG